MTPYKPSLGSLPTPGTVIQCQVTVSPGKKEQQLIYVQVVIDSSLLSQDKQMEVKPCGKCRLRPPSHRPPPQTRSEPAPQKRNAEVRAEPPRAGERLPAHEPRVLQRAGCPGGAGRRGTGFWRGPKEAGHSAALWMFEQSLVFDSERG